MDKNEIALELTKLIFDKAFSKTDNRKDNIDSATAIATIYNQILDKIK